jgi:hypothetical protein
MHIHRGGPHPQRNPAAPTTPMVAASALMLSLYSSSGRGARATSNLARNSVDPERWVKGAASPKSMRRIRGAAVGELG